MRFIAVLLILLFPSLSFASDKASGGRNYDAHGVKKQGTKKPYYHKKGFHFESEDGDFSTNLQWRAQMRFSSGNRSDPTEESDFSGPRTVQDFELRRVRMKIGGHGYKYVKYYFEIDLQPSRSVSAAAANSSGRVIDWRIDVQPYEWFGFRVGQWKINYNRERVDSSGRQTFVERSIVNREFTIDRQVGVMVKGRLNKGTAADFRYYAGIFNGEGRSVQNNSDSMMKMARLQWNPLGRDLKWRQSDVERHEKPTLSIAGAWAGNKGSCSRWSSSGCGGLDGLAVDTTNTERYDINQYLAEVAYKYQGFSLQSEYHWKIIDDAETLENHEMEGMYVNVGYFFNEINAAIPEELELAFRYAFVDEPNSTRTIQENKRQEFTWAANYFIAGHGNKITADFSYLTLDDRRLDDKFDETRFRLQWDISF
ncbi:MAG: porin [Nitrospinota bacterium]